MSREPTEIVRNTLLTLILLSYCIFLYFVAIILYVYFTNPHIREKARYVLFVHMLINDTLLLSVIICLYLLAIYLIFFPLYICYPLLTYTVSAFRVTPYNLAVMSLEQYFAICYPLRYAEVCTAQRSLLAIRIMWIVTLFPQFLDLFAMCYSMPRNFFSTIMECKWLLLVMNSFQSILRSTIEIGSFTLVGLVIFYTYVRVMMVARKMGSGKSSAFKAKKTVLLHAVQLGLCMLSFTTSLTEVYLRRYFYFIPITSFFLFICLPRSISPLIYGIRDQVFQKQMRKMNFLT
ncbi:odorant receptor 131-2-like [Engystomops pustulosus]|uniref:odorant receptor 131-2-like n=1 Tax=Engystomops pustulosus TaxID=76066 RepID=UPI003AFB459D